MSDDSIAWLSTAAAAERLGITPRTLYRFIDEGQLAAYKFGRVIRLKQDDVDAYIEILIERFSNPQIRDQVARLCSDGSGKLPKFLLPTIRTHLAGGGPTDLGGLLLATWCQYVLGTTDGGQPLELAPDPLQDQITAAAAASVADPASFLSLEPVFDSALQSNPALKQSFVAALESIRAEGLRSTIRNATGGLGVATRNDPNG